MTDTQRKAVVEAIRKQTTANTRSKKAAIAGLTQMGFLTEKGGLCPEYGGPAKRGGGKASAAKM